MLVAVELGWQGLQWVPQRCGIRSERETPPLSVCRGIRPPFVGTASRALAS